MTSVEKFCKKFKSFQDKQTKLFFSCLFRFKIIWFLFFSRYSLWKYHTINLNPSIELKFDIKIGGIPSTDHVAQIPPPPYFLFLCWGYLCQTGDCTSISFRYFLVFCLTTIDNPPHPYFQPLVKNFNLSGNYTTTILTLWGHFNLYSN